MTSHAPRKEAAEGRAAEANAQLTTAPQSRISRTLPPTTQALRVVIPCLLASLAFVIYTGFSLAQWQSFRAPSWDLGIFTQLADRYAHFQAPIVNIKGDGFNLLGDHFHPILVLLGPIFRLWPSGSTLLVVQNLLFAISIVPVCSLAMRRLGATAGSVLGISYAFSWGLTAAIVAQFHEIAFAVPLLAFGITCALTGHLRAAAILVGLNVFVKEDMGVTVAAFGLALIVAQVVAERERRGYKRWRRAIATREGRIGKWLIVWGIGWLVASLIFLTIMNNAGGWEYTNRLTGSDHDAMTRIGMMAVTLLFTIATAGLVGLVSPLVIVALPTLIWRFAGNVEFYWGMDWHYSAVLMPIAALALVDGACRLRARWPRSARPGKQSPGNQDTGSYSDNSAVLHDDDSELLTSKPGTVATSKPTESVATAHATSQILTWGAVIIALAGTLFGTANNGFGAWLKNPQLSSEANRQAAQSLIDGVGNGNTVVTDICLLAYLVPTNNVYWSGTSEGAEPNLVAFSPCSKSSAETFGAEKFGGVWSTDFSESGYEIARNADVASLD